MNLMNQNTDPLSITLCPNDQQILSSESYEYKVNIRAHSQDIVSLKVADENVTQPKQELSKELSMSNVDYESYKNTTEDSNTKCYSGQNDANSLKAKNLTKLLDDATGKYLKNKGKERYPRKCPVPKCTTTASTGFYLIPDHPKRKQEWLNACKMPPSTKDFRICWKHFLPSDFKNEIDEESIAQLRFGNLMKNVVPSRNLPQDSDLIPKIEDCQKEQRNLDLYFSGTEILEVLDANCLKTKSLTKLLDNASSNDLNKKRKCHVPKCTTRENRGFYTVPEHPKRREEYLNACKMLPSTKDLKICWKHFLPSDFKNEIDEESIAQFRFGSLKKNVVPSRNLPQDSDLTPTIPTVYSISELTKKNEIEEDIIAQLRLGNLNKNVVPNQNLPKDSDVIKTNAKLCKKEQKYEDLCFTDTDIQEVLDNENFSKKKSSNFNEDIMENLEFSNCDNQKVLELPSRNLPEDSDLIIRNSEVCKNVPASKRFKLHYKNLHPGKPIITKGLTTFNCTICDEFFFTGWELDRHLNLDHEIQTKLNFCKKCKMSYEKEHRHCKVENVYPCQTKNLPQESDLIPTIEDCKKEQKHVDLCFTGTEIKEVLDNENFSKKKSSNFSEDIMETLEFPNCDNQKVLEVPSRNLPEDSELIIRNGEVCKKMPKYVDLYNPSKDSLEVLGNEKNDEKESLDIKEEITETLSDSLKFQNCEKIKNPWMVDNASVFLKYCCPECEFSNQDLQTFSDHAIENHKDALALFPVENLIVESKDAIPLKLQEQCESCLFVECVCNANNQNVNLDKNEKLTTDTHANNINSLPVENTLEEQGQENSSEIPKECGECEFGQCVCLRNMLHCKAEDLSASKIEYRIDNNDEKQASIKGTINDEHFILCQVCPILQLSSFDAIRKHRIEKHIDMDALKFYCPLCNKRLEFWNNLKYHIDKIHNSKEENEVTKQVLCEVCPLLQLSSVKEVMSHRSKIHMKDKKICCPHCDQSLTVWKNLKIHIDAKHPEHAEKKFRCNECRKTFIFECSCNSHKSQAHQKVKKVCDICGAEFIRKGDLDNHMIIKHDAKGTQLSCDKCAFSTMSRVKLTRHKYNKHDSGNHKQCPHCDYETRTNQKLNRHIDNNHSDHDAEKKHVCEKCGKQFMFESSLIDHVKYLCKNSDHETKSARYTKQRNTKYYLSKKIAPNLELKCDYCEKVLMTSKRVKIHYSNFHPGKPIIANHLTRLNCKNCDEFFFTSKELDRHLNLDHEIETKLNYCKKCKQSYTNEHKHCVKDNVYPSQTEKFLCNECGIYCKTKQCLKSHIERVHEKLKHVCDQCNKSYSSKGLLLSHKQSVHDNCKAFECRPCEKQFGSNLNLRKHNWQSHSQMTCEICGKQAANPNLMRKHKVFVHNETKGVLFCEKCPKSVFFTQSQFEKHMKDKH